MRSRLVSAVILGLIVLLLTWAGGFGFRLLCLGTGIVIFDEWSRMTRAKAAGPLYVFSRRSLFASLIFFLFGFPVLAVLVAVAAGSFIAFVDRRERKADWALGGLAYAAVAAIPPGLLRGDDWTGLAALGFVIAVVWPTDIFAYFTGRAIGGPKLLPMVSPKKTISGAIGGLAAGVVFGAAFHWALTGKVEISILLLAALLSVLGQGGDLYESWIKRRFGVKDTGRIIPGHGGLMDRIDGLIVATAAAWLIGVLVAGFDNPAGAIFAFH